MTASQKFGVELEKLMSLSATMPDRVHKAGKTIAQGLRLGMPLDDATRALYAIRSQQPHMLPPFPDGGEWPEGTAK